MNTDPNDTTASGQPRMIDIVAAELKELQTDSLNFRGQVETAKTTTKRQYFQKKLKKNNKRMMNMLVAFDKLHGRQVDTSTNAVPNPEPERPEVPSEDDSSEPE